VLLVVPAIAWVIKVFAYRLRSLNRHVQANIGDVTHVLEESIRGHKVVKIYDGAAFERHRFDVQSNRARLLFYKVKVAAAANTPLVELLGAIAMGAIIYLAANSNWGGGEFSVGGFVSFFGAIALMFSPLKRLTKINAPLQRGLAAAESIFGLIDESGEPDTGTRRLPRVTGELELQRVSFAYEVDRNPVLRGVDLHIRPKEMVALVGRSGGGKSTLVSLLPRLYDPTAGRILLDGIDIREVSLADLRAQIALVSQDVNLFNDTIAANIAYGIDPHPPERLIREAARSSHALEFIDRLPEGLNTRIGEDGLRLSGGQRQRIALARALLKDAPILILDEATSALDTESERAIQASLQEQRQRRTTIVIAHRLSTVERADRILVIDKGRIIEAGRHRELITRGGVYADLYQTQFSLS
jgi:subfamily B ATP-binding cassette protein MsbA